MPPKKQADKDALFAGRSPGGRYRGDEDDDDNQDETKPLKASSSSSSGAGAGGSVLAQATVRRELEEQDKVLDALHSSVTRLGAISEAIHEEITVQDRMLTELEEDVIRTDARVNDATRRTNQLIRRTEGQQWNCALVTMVVVLLVLILWILFG